MRGSPAPVGIDRRVFVVHLPVQGVSTPTVLFQTLKRRESDETDIYVEHRLCGAVDNRWLRWRGQQSMAFV